MWWKLIGACLLALFAVAAAQNSEPDCSSVLSYAFFPLEDECDQFVFCNDGEVELFQCGEDLIWSQDDGACVLGDKETCVPWTPEIACGNNTVERVIEFPRNCGKYIWCGVDEVEVMECDPGTIFSKVDLKCIVGSVRTCESLEHLCDDAENDALRHPDRCDVAIVCEEETVIAKPCPEGDIFLEDFGICVPGDTVSCQPLPLEEMCVNRTNQILMHPDRCQSYVNCQNGLPTVVNCPRGTIFFPRNMTCVVGRIVDEETCEVLDEVCVNATIGEYREHSEGVCDVFVECLENEFPLIHFCPSGRLWSQRWLMCVPGNQNNCQRSPLETICDHQPFGAIFPHPEDDCSQFVSCNITHTNEIPCPVNHIVLPGTLDCVPGDPSTCATLDDMCEGKTDEYIYLPDDCERFIHCQNDQGSLVICPPGEIFDAGLQKCTPGNTELCEPLDCMADISRHPNYCNMYFDCQLDKVNIYMCPHPLIWHDFLWRCTPGSSTDCAYDPLDTICIDRFDNEVFPYPTQEPRCDSYVTCLQGEATAQTCPPGMVLQRQSLDCIPGNGRTCEVFTLQSCSNFEEWVVIHPSMCNIRIICSLGRISTLECPEGQIVNEETMICEPGICVEPDPADTICVGQTDGVLLPAIDSENCIDYYECQDEVAIGGSCPEGNIFHREERICIPGVTSRCEDLRNYCLEKPNGNFLFPEDGKCNLYLECYDGTTGVSSCFSGDIFIDENVGVCIPGTVPECEPLPISTMCDGRENVQIYPHPDDCTSFVTCQNNEASIYECSRGNMYFAINRQCFAGDSCLLFDGCSDEVDGTILPHPTASECDLYVECINGFGIAKECPAGNIITPETDNECVPGDVDTCTATSGDELCARQLDGTQLPHDNPENCIDYYRCENHVSSTRRCPDGTIFHKEENQCVPGISESSGCVDLRDRCLQNTQGIMPYAGRCDMFLACIDFQTTVNFCAAGQIFLESKQICIPGVVDGCIATGDINQFCKDRSDGKYSYPHPHLFFLYVECSRGALTVSACAMNQFFDADINECIV
nr:uncharacterized protein LOC115268142 [Aedes albopictus]